MVKTASLLSQAEAILGIGEAGRPYRHWAKLRVSTEAGHGILCCTGGGLPPWNSDAIVTRNLPREIIMNRFPL